MASEHFGDFERADAILSRALEEAPEERERFIERECGTDRALLERVRGLLEMSEESGVLSPGGGLSARFWPDTGTREEKSFSGGERIGPWRIVKELGRGGMGVIYLAEREGDLGSGSGAGFEQRVALKLVKRGMDTEAILTRFHNERRVLAALEHPNIARLIDGGATEGGQPWFAMEYIEGGLPITEYCDQNRLSIGQRISLMIKVCETVQFPHSRLIIHRDLKPSNILVTKEGEPKLLDFGLAKVLHNPEGDATVTVREQRWMTLDYASPEQIRGNPVGTPSDTYQLGLILYELLTGKKAYSVKGLSPTEAERVICEQAPTRPSTAVQAMEEGRFLRSKRSPSGMPSHVQTRDASELRIAQLSPNKLRKRLKGDLDTILLKALHKDPARGYTTAEHLADDLRAYLEGRPVTARPDSVAYRMRKFVTRHATGMAVAAGVVALVVALVAFYTIRLQDERDRARAEADKAEQVAEFLAGVFRLSDPLQTAGEEVSVRTALDRGAERIRQELSDQPVVRAELMDVLGRTYLELGDFDTAQSLLEQALDLRRLHLRPDDPELAETLRHVGLLWHQKGEYDRAESPYLEALEILERSFGQHGLELGAVLNNLGILYRRTGKYETGVETLKRALAIRERHLGNDAVDVGKVLINLGALLQEMGQYERAAAHYQRAWDIYERELGPDHPFVAGAIGNLAMVRQRLGELDGLEPMYRRMLAIHRKSYGATHEKVGTALDALGDFLARSERYHEAIDVYKESVRIYRKALGPEHPFVAYPLMGLGDLYLSTGRPEEAFPYFQEAAVVRETSLGLEHPLLAFSLDGLARAQMELGETETAEHNLRRAEEIRGRAESEP